MPQPRGHPNFLVKAFRAKQGAEVRVQHLEGDGTVVAEITRQVDGRHAAPTQLTLDGVAVDQGGAKRLKRVAHALADRSRPTYAPR